MLIPLIALCLFLLIPSCTTQEKVYRESRIAMDTITTITVVSPSRKKAEEAIEAGFTEIKRLEQILNYFSPDSEITAINNLSGISPVKVSRETIEIIKMSLEIADATGGIFNPTIGPVIKLWKFSRQDKADTIPSEEAIMDALRMVDYKRVRVDEKRSEIFLELKGMEIDLGGIAKGYVADRAIDVIKKMNIKAGLVAIAGDIKGFGLRPDQRPWNVGIQDPRPVDDKTDGVFATLYLENRAISTSGDYQRFFIKDGKRYHHIIDPRTGYPAESSVISVSVIADNGFIADGITTAMFIFPPHKAKAFLESLGVEGVIVDNQKRLYITKGLKGKIEIIDKRYEIK